MLHHFHLRQDWNEVAQWAGIMPADLPQLPSHFQLRQGKYHPVLRMRRHSSERQITWMREGLIPSYACDEEGAEQRAEAHAEAMTCDSCFRSAFRRRRCIVPATSIQQRRHLASGIEQSCSFQLESGSIFGIAAVWETWTNDEGHAVDSFAIVTAQVIPELHTLFDRMPVVLMQQKDADRWLRIRDTHEDAPLDLLRTLSTAELRMWRMTPGDVDVDLTGKTAQAWTAPAL